MYCERCGCDYCEMVECAFVCPICSETFVPSEEQKLFMKLKENLTIDVKVEWNWLEISLLFNGREITTGRIETGAIRHKREDY